MSGRSATKPSTHYFYKPIKVPVTIGQNGTVVSDFGIIVSSIEIIIIAVCKKLVKTQINTILAHEIVRAISQEPLAQLTWSLLQPF